MYTCIRMCTGCIFVCTLTGAIRRCAECTCICVQDVYVCVQEEMCAYMYWKQHYIAQPAARTTQLHPPDSCRTTASATYAWHPFVLYCNLPARQRQKAFIVQALTASFGARSATMAHHPMNWTTGTQITSVNGGQVGSPG